MQVLTLAGDLEGMVNNQQFSDISFQALQACTRTCIGTRRCTCARHMTSARAQVAWPCPQVEGRTVYAHKFILFARCGDLTQDALTVVRRAWHEWYEG